MKYNDIVQNICGHGWASNDEERNGGYGVCMMIAYIKGVEPNLKALSSHLDIESRWLKKPFMKMFGSGLFSENFNARNNMELLGKGFSEGSQHLDYWTEDDAYRASWCNVAAIASGFLKRSFR